MNTFIIGGFVRDKCEEVRVEGKVYTATVIATDDKQCLIPVYATGNLANRFIRTLAVGTQVEITGHFITTIEFHDAVAYTRMYLVAEKLTLVKAPKIKFKNNVVVSKLISLVDTDDLLKAFKTKGKAKKKRKEEKDVK